MMWTVVDWGCKSRGSIMRRRVESSANRHRKTTVTAPLLDCTHRRMPVGCPKSRCGFARKHRFAGASIECGSDVVLGLRSPDRRGLNLALASLVVGAVTLMAFRSGRSVEREIATSSIRSAVLEIDDRQFFKPYFGLAPAADRTQLASSISQFRHPQGMRGMSGTLRGMAWFWNAQRPYA